MRGTLRGTLWELEWDFEVDFGGDFKGDLKGVYEGELRKHSFGQIGERGVGAMPYRGMLNKKKYFIVK